MTIRTVEEDWAEAWKAHFEPLVVGRIVVKPSWREFEATDGQLIVEIDPGMAFGTGNHPTTRLCLLLLQKHVRPGSVVVDIGTGSGILAIAAMRLGASRVCAVDIDPLAVDIARRNLEANGLLGRAEVFQCDGPPPLQASADVVVANVIASAVSNFAPGVSALLKPNGVYLASGIVEDRGSQVLAAMRRAGFRIVRAIREDGWLAVAGKKVGHRC